MRSPRLEVTVITSTVPSFASTLNVVDEPSHKGAVVLGTTVLPRWPVSALVPCTVRGLDC